MSLKSEKKTTKTVAKRGERKETKATKKVAREEPLPSEEELVEDMDTVAEEILFGKNQARSYALRDVWFSSLKEVVDDQTVPKENKDEIMFLTLTNALMDMFMDVVPKEMALSFARNLDDYLAVTLVNREYNVDLLKLFQEEFTAKMGSDFETDEKLMAALGEFEDRWWSTPRKDLKDKSPNEVLEEMNERYEL